LLEVALGLEAEALFVSSVRLESTAVASEQSEPNLRIKSIFQSGRNVFETDVEIEAENPGHPSASSTLDVKAVVSADLTSSVANVVTAGPSSGSVCMLQTPDTPWRLRQQLEGAAVAAAVARRVTLRWALWLRLCTLLVPWYARRGTSTRRNKYYICVLL
jgi:hypothetical protein